MSNRNNMIPIPGRLHSVAVGEPVSGADEVLDDALNMEQSKINQLTVGTKNASTGTTGAYPYNGMGRVVLPKNMVNGVNTLTQDMLYKGDPGSRVPNTNTIFVIQYDYVLAEDITVPANCVLEFDGGSISGAYTITGTNTNITAEPNKQIFSDVNIQGTWVVKDIYVAWMNIPDVTECMNPVSSICRLQNDNIQQNLYFPNYRLNISPINNYLCFVSSNTNIIVPNIIALNSGNTYNNGVFYIFNKKNISILGGGTLIGDAETHDYSTESSYNNCNGVRCLASKNIQIKDLSILKFIEDGIYLGGSNETSFGLFDNACEDIIIQNVKCNYNDRQGLSIIHANNILIEGCEFNYTGTISAHAPSAGIDFEPNHATQSISNISIDSCIFNHNSGSAIIFALQYALSTDIFKDFHFTNCTFATAQGNTYKDEHLIVNNGGININSTSVLKNINFDNCDIHIIGIDNNSVDGDINFNKCHIYGICHYNYDITILNKKKLHFYDCVFSSGKTIMVSESKLNPFYCRICIECDFYNCKFDYIDYDEAYGYVGEEGRIVGDFYNCTFNWRLPGVAKTFKNCTMIGDVEIPLTFIKGKSVLIDGNVDVKNISTVSGTVDYYNVGNNDSETKIIFTNNTFCGEQHTGSYNVGYLFRESSFNNVVPYPIIYTNNKASKGILTKNFGQYVLDHYTGSHLNRVEPFVYNSKLVFYTDSGWVDATGTPV